MQRRTPSGVMNTDDSKVDSDTVPVAVSKSLIQAQTQGSVTVTQPIQPAPAPAPAPAQPVQPVFLPPASISNPSTEVVRETSPQGRYVKVDYTSI